jgi:glycerophosphoryl diester phosphodiesterase
LLKNRNLRYIVVLLLVLFVSTDLHTVKDQDVAAFFSFEDEEPAEPIVKPWTDYRLIAHAMGGIDGHDYTSSREAFETNYELGHRLFETDLILTSDNHLAGRHDWEEYLAEQFEQDIPIELKGQALTLKTFKKLKIFHQYHPMSFSDVAKLMSSHPDVYITTDTKEIDEELVGKQFTEMVKKANKIDPSILQRIVPEIYSPEMYSLVMSIYPFPSVMYSTYMSSASHEQVIDFMVSKQIKTVAIPSEDISPAYVRALVSRGIKIYVSTVNKPKEIKQYLKMGVYGFYTDFLTYDDVTKAKIPIAPM